MRRNFKKIKRNIVILFFAAILAVSQMIACSSTQSISKTESSNLDGESNNKPEMPPSMDNERPNPPDMNGERPTPPNGFGGGPNGGPNDGPGGMPGGGTLYATNVTATTNGGSSAAIRSDRGGGTMIVNGGTFISHGAGSPALYCTADITVNDATLVANCSEGICIEGLNTTTLKNVDLTSNMPDQSQNDNTWSVIVYQSMSGDSKIGKGTFNMDGGTLTSKNGGIFYTTNTESEFNITNVDLKPSDDFEFLLQATGNNNKRGWGNTGKNGANCTFNANYQEMNGKIIYDSISTLNLNLLNETTFTGAILNDVSFTGVTVGYGTANVTIDDNSKWIVTENSEITSLTLKGSLIDIDGNNVKVVDTNGNVLRDGSSEYVVTADNLS